VQYLNFPEVLFFEKKLKEKKTNKPRDGGGAQRLRGLNEIPISHSVLASSGSRFKQADLKAIDYALEALSFRNTHGKMCRSNDPMPGAVSEW